MVGEHEAPSKHAGMNEALYNTLKRCALYIFPALGAAYFSLADLWNLPKAEEVVGTVVIIDTFLGVILGISKHSYDNSDEKYAGELTVVPDEENETTDLKFSFDADKVGSEKEVLIKVNRVEP